MTLIVVGVLLGGLALVVNNLQLAVIGVGLSLLGCQWETNKILDSTRSGGLQ